MLFFKIETLVEALKALGHIYLWHRDVEYRINRPGLRFIVTLNNRRLASWSEQHHGWVVTDEIRCIPLNKSLAAPHGTPISEEWVFHTSLLEQNSSTCI